MFQSCTMIHQQEIQLVTIDEPSNILDISNANNWILARAANVFEVFFGGN